MPEKTAQVHPPRLMNIIAQEIDHGNGSSTVCGYSLDGKLLFKKTVPSNEVSSFGPSAPQALGESGQVAGGGESQGTCGSPA